MDIVFISNFFNHHQKQLSDELFRLTNGCFYFVETTVMSDDRVKMGYTETTKPTYVISSNHDIKQIDDLIFNADVVIIGSADLKYVRKRLCNNKLTFKYSERIFKEGYKKIELIPRIILAYYRWGRYKNFHLLCASGFASNDYNKLLCFKNKSYKFGYFPPKKTFDNLDIVNLQKEKNSILWVSRMIDWKHPEIVLKLAERLKEEKYNVQIIMVGDGPLLDNIKNLINSKKLNENIKIITNLKPTEVRILMEKSLIFIHTADFNEGWGAVINEALNSCCATIVSHAVGSAPFLIKDGYNGMVFENENVNELVEKVKLLLNDRDLTKKIAIAGYNTIDKQWNGKVAAERLIELSSFLLTKQLHGYENGPCSNAEIIHDDWYVIDKYKI